MKGRVLKNVPGEIKALELGNGVFEVIKEIDVLCMTPDRQQEKKRNHDNLIVSTTIAAGFAAGVGLCGAFVMPVMGFLFVIGLAWLGVVTFANRGKHDRKRKL